MRDNTFSENKIEMEIPHENHPVEWWFFQGFYCMPDNKQFHFMISLFRTNVALNDEPKQNGFSVIISHLDAETGTNNTVSKIDKAVLESILKRIKQLDETELDKDLTKILYKELRRHGPPRPIELSEDTAELKANSLEISWGDIKIAQDGNGFILEFSLPKTNQFYSFLMKPEFPRMVFECEERNKLLKGEMRYVTYPRMQLKGLVNGEEVHGNAWFDHQWGNTSWFITDDSNKKMLGWDWFGINLNNGLDIVLSSHKFMKNEETILTSAVVHYPGNKLEEFNNVIINPKKHWESPTTHIKYPIVWEIQIPEIELNIKFEPLIDDQEIALIGIGRALWEGAGKINGTLKGEKISGRARAEFFGYGYVFDFQEYLQTLANRVDKRIEEFFPKEFDDNQIQKFVGKPFWKHEPSAYTQMLSTPVWDLISRRGKRWRPIFGILMGEALGIAAEKYEASACLAELVHSGALIIDDIQDNSLLRRGEQCLHLKYGLDAAINAGNTLYFLPSVELFNHKYLDDLKKLRIHEIMMRTYLQAHFGQTVDIYWSKYLTPENLKTWMNDSLEDKILQMYDYKTAAGAKGLAEVSAVIAEVNDDIKQTCIDYARAFAVAFQIIDDVHNFSDSPRWTKVCGEDLANGKLTYVIARALKLLDNIKSQRLIEILCSQDQRKNKDILIEGIQLIRNSGALEECIEKAKKMSLNESDRFSEIIPSCEPKIMLIMLCLKMLDLAYDT